MIVRLAGVADVAGATGAGAGSASGAGASGGCGVGRRTVLCGAAAAFGGAVLSACEGSAADGDGGSAGGGATTPGATPSAGPSGGGGAGAVLVALDDVAVGSAVSATSSDGPVLIVRTSPTEVVGFSAVCPHQGCTVAPSDAGLACPCHGSAFDLSGAVVRGPATRDLSPYPVTVVDGEVVPA